MLLIPLNTKILGKKIAAFFDQFNCPCGLNNKM